MKVMKRAIDTVAIELWNIINLSLKTGVVPQPCKIAKVCLYLKVVLKGN